MLYSLQKLQIYDLLNRNRAKEAKNFFFSHFSNFLQDPKFKNTMENFNFLFANGLLASTFVKDKLAEIKKHFYFKLEKILLELLNRNGFIELCNTPEELSFVILSKKLTGLDLFEITNPEQEIVDNLKKSLEAEKGKNYFDIFVEKEQSNSDIFNILNQVKELKLSLKGKSINDEFCSNFHSHVNNIQPITDPIQKEDCKWRMEENLLDSSFESDITLISDSKHEDKELLSVIKEEAYFPDPKKDPSSNFISLSRKVVPKIEKVARLKNQIPFLKSFHPKFIKKENIDKKILRKFRKVLKKDVKINEVKDNIDYDFIASFVVKNLLPPMKYEETEFKSFNTKFLVWLFSKNGMEEIYDKFVNEYGISLWASFVETYNLNEEEPEIIDSLLYYIKNMHLFYTTKFESNMSDIGSQRYTSQICSEEILESILGIDMKSNNWNNNETMRTSFTHYDSNMQMVVDC